MKWHGYFWFSPARIFFAIVIFHLLMLTIAATAKPTKIIFLPSRNIKGISRRKYACVQQRVNNRTWSKYKYKDHLDITHYGQHLREKCYNKVCYNCILNIWYGIEFAVYRQFVNNKENINSRCILRVVKQKHGNHSKSELEQNINTQKFIF